MKIYANIRKVDEDINEQKEFDDNFLNSLKEGDFIWLIDENCPVRFIQRRVGDWTSGSQKYDVVEFFRIDGYSAMNAEIRKETRHSWCVKGKVTPKELAEYHRILMKMANFFKPCVQQF